MTVTITVIRPRAVS